MRRFIVHFDHRLMRRVHRWPAPLWVRWWMLAATRGGDGWLWWAAGVLVALAGGPRRVAAIASALAASATGIAFYLAVKRITDRKRPCEFEGHCWAELLPPDRFSFPSGHTIVAFAISTVLSLFYPAIAALAIFCAVSVAASRIVLGMHFLSDVLAGVAIGIALGYGAAGLVPRLVG